MPLQDYIYQFNYLQILLNVKDEANKLILKLKVGCKNIFIES
jgi:hypothetical protein